MSEILYPTKFVIEPVFLEIVCDKIKVIAAMYNLNKENP